MTKLNLSARRDCGRIAVTRFGRDFGLDLDQSPFGRDVHAAFDRMAAQAALSRDAATALLYRVFVQQALAQGEDAAAPDRGALLAALAHMLDRSAAYSEAAPDHLTFEAVSSPMTAWIATRLAEAGCAGHA
ncbi:hypothetical protein C8P66_12244 [Humitalea rosea]|uniref:Uncharacterized protein n=1 Tax=Humitalea rosea TaxID=990373 RepID=A0A2W7INU3_9PROT|nr:hypothetical protein [Humitalea rosea]PZW41057.1 hypothetical protein C8P66_12244 [Humitalea rosea]